MKNKAKKHNKNVISITDKLDSIKDKETEVIVGEIVTPAELNADDKAKLEKADDMSGKIQRFFKKLLAGTITVIILMALLQFSGIVIAGTISSSLKINGVLSNDGVLIGTTAFVTSIFWLLVSKVSIYKFVYSKLFRGEVKK